ncbi:MAG: hypothetical protein JRJ74_01690 [Deltaproteobacteria bacterium]|nr:hypothetical protein [Deltaproteobacteria bacterium]
MSASLQHRVKHATPEWQPNLNVSPVMRLRLPLFCVPDISFIIKKSLFPAWVFILGEYIRFLYQSKSKWTFLERWLRIKKMKAHKIPFKWIFI